MISMAAANTRVLENYSSDFYYSLLSISGCEILFQVADFFAASWRSVGSWNVWNLVVSRFRVQLASLEINVYICRLKNTENAPIQLMFRNLAW